MRVWSIHLKPPHRGFRVARATSGYGTGVGLRIEDLVPVGASPGEGVEEQLKM